jgi:hypothetical protein
MNKDEAQKIELALDGIMANLETLRTVIGQLTDENPLETHTGLLTTDQEAESNICSHENIRQIETMGGIQSYCFDCDHAE